MARDTPFRIMTVCTGNICRSPMAEIVLRQAFADAGMSDHVVVDSTGISSEEFGNPLDRRARRVLTARGYDDGHGHRARRVRPHELAERDLVLPMTSHHARTLRRLSGNADAANVIRMWRTFDPAVSITAGSEEHDDAHLDVDDPWYGGMDDFDLCLDQLEAATPAIVEYVRQRLTAAPAAR